MDKIVIHSAIGLIFLIILAPPGLLAVSLETKENDDTGLDERSG